MNGFVSQKSSHRAHFIFEQPDLLSFAVARRSLQTHGRGCKASVGDARFEGLSSSCKVSKEARGEEAEAASPAKASPGEKATTPKDSPPKAPKPDAPPIMTLLEFIAWLALQWLVDSSGGPLSKGSGIGWANGRGGFLADQLEDVQDASIRLQVTSLTPHPPTPHLT